VREGTAATNVTRSVSIVIPTWNGLELLKRFLPTVIAAATCYTRTVDAPTEIIIVDDASVDETVAWLVSQGFVEEKRRGEESRQAEEPKTAVPSCITSSSEPSSRHSLLPSLTLVRNETNRGFGETCNRGFEAARYPLVFLLNNDVEVDPDSIAPLVENFADDSVFAAHCRVFELGSTRECGTGKIGSFARGFIRVHKSYVAQPANLNDEEQNHRVRGSRPPLYSLFAGGGSAMFDRKKFIEIGGFDILLSPFYWEDVELSYRAWKRGYIVIYEPRSVTHHRVSSTISKLDRRKVRVIEQRNRLIYHWIHLQAPSLLISHVLWVLLLAVTAPLRLKPSFVSSCMAALKRLPEIRKRRLEERRAARRSDRDVFDIFDMLERRTDVTAYDQYSELGPNRPTANAPR
jgi:GT2 family glycosyltransferase